MPTYSRTTILLATDHSGSVLNAIDTTKNNTIAYTAFGDSPMDGDPQSQLRFNGAFRESITGCYSLGNGYRVYSPILMRFLSPDRWSPFGAGWLNAYAYCGGDPRNRYDPNGQAFQYFLKLKILRPTFKYASKTSNELTRTPLSTTSRTGSAYDSIGLPNSRGSFSSNYESIKSYSSAATIPSVPARSPPPSLSDLSSIGSHSFPSLRSENPMYVSIHGTTNNRASHGINKTKIKEWAESTEKFTPYEPFETLVQNPRNDILQKKNLILRDKYIQKDNKRKLYAALATPSSKLPYWLDF